MVMKYEGGGVYSARTGTRRETDSNKLLARAEVLGE